MDRPIPTRGARPAPQQRNGRRPAPQQIPGGRGRPTRTSSGEIHTREPQPAARPTKRQTRADAPARAPQEGRRPAPPGQRPRPDGSGQPRPRPAKPRTAETVGGPKRPGEPKRARKPKAAAKTAQPEAAKAKPVKPKPSGDSGTPPTEPPTPRRGFFSSGGGRRRVHQAGQLVVALLSVATLAIAGYSWKSTTDVTAAITQLGGLDLGGAQDGAVDILLVGTDSRTDAKGVPLTSRELRWLRAGDDISTNTDTILLIRVPNNGASATAISIPRDAYVDVPGLGKSKINAAYGATKEKVRRTEVEHGGNPDKAERDGTQAGRKALIGAVDDLTGVKVDHYAEVGLLGFALLTNAVGGVDVCLKAPVRDVYSGAKFRQGRQTLNGPKALSFVRQRHGLPRGDLDRITRQQVFMASLAQKMLSAKVLTDSATMKKLQTAVSRSVVIDDGWDILSFAEKLRDLSGGKVRFATIPIVTEEGWNEEGQSIVQVDPKAVHAFTNDLLEDKSTKKQKAGKDGYAVDVVNAGTIDGLASNVSNILTAKGFGPGQTSTKPMNERDSIIFTRSADDDIAKQLSETLGGVAIRSDPTMPARHARVVLTNTYYGPGSIMDTSPQPDAQKVAAAKRRAADRAGSARAPITAATNGPMCVN
ncbi:LCP family protein [Gordonia sp. X0973]|uniref:LCP family protein n=1 Tax=Gordonia sp. X0973 TaxID=2742602 RepID=UPI0026574445|nr:LCP family protein [Gordonia sp. X0973]